MAPEISFQPEPVFNCHWYVPVATTEKVALVPTQAVWLDGCVVMAGPAPAFTVKVPGDNVFALFNVTKPLLPGKTGLAANVIVVPAGTPAVAANVIGLVNPPLGIVGNTTFIVAGAGQVAVAGEVGPKLKPVGGGVIVKLALEISKKILQKSLKIYF